MKWHELKWPDIEILGHTQPDLPVMIPTGSLEQHGRHLPLFVDSILVTAIAEQVERACTERVLLLPTLWLGASHHHLDFPGTVSLMPSLYSQVIQSVAGCVMKAGFRRLFFLNGHGGNEVPITQALNELVYQNDAADRAFLAFASWWQVSKDAITPDKIGMHTSSISHACEYETSISLAVRPDLVDMALIEESPAVIGDELHSADYGGRVRVFRRFHRLTRSGSWGKPSTSTVEKGEHLVQAAAGEVEHFLDTFAKWPDLPVLKPVYRSEESLHVK